MPELRWILIVAGVLLLAGIWWWESRRRSRELDGTPEQPPRDEPVRSEPTLGEEPPDESGATADDLPPIRASRRERNRELPVVEIPEDAEPELLRAPVREEVPIRVPYRAMQKSLDERPEVGDELPPSEPSDAEEREPWLRTQPLERRKLMNGDGEPVEPFLQSAEIQDDTSSGADSGEAVARDGDHDEPEFGATAETGTGQRQKIVALRLVCKDERWPGDAVIHALESEGLRFGRYSIFHRERDDGKSIFYVASMIEPGSFDLDRTSSTSFPGISIFAVLPGPVDGGSTFDMMLATARRLAQRLSGNLQDEQGSTLTAQRVLNLREEVLHFEHIARRLRSR